MKLRNIDRPWIYTSFDEVHLVNDANYREKDARYPTGIYWKKSEKKEDHRGRVTH